MEKAEEDTGKLSESIGLAEADLQAEEDDDAFFTQAAAVVEEAEAAYYRRQVDQSNSGEPSHSNRVVVENGTRMMSCLLSMFQTKDLKVHLPLCLLSARTSSIIMLFNVA